MNKFSYPIIYDYHGTLDSLNQFPKNRIFQTFLLDKDNKVILIGNPIWRFNSENNQRENII